MRVLRVYHAGRDPGHRRRERALIDAGAELTLVVPRQWPDSGAQAQLSPEPFRIIELDVERAGDVNRHKYAAAAAVRSVVEDVKPDVIDIHEEPFSSASRQWLRAAGPRPVVMYTAQNIDKRFPPPFAQYERAALGRVAALYPCTRQAASVARGKGFAGAIDVLPLGYDDTLYSTGQQSVNSESIVLGLVGRLVAEKGVLDAVRVLAVVRAARPARLHLVGSGPELEPARRLAAALGVADALDVTPWAPVTDMAAIYRSLHVVLVPSASTQTWVEQFGRIIVEGQASGAVVAGYASGSIPEVGGDAAVLVDEGDVDALADAVTDLVKDPGDYERRRHEGLRATADLGWAAIGRRQVALYESVLTGGTARVQIPATPRGRRAAARAEFGAPARTTAGERPFALPYLRRDTVVSRALGAAIDRAVRG